MDNINKVYGNLTGVDIEKQKQIWDERGKGYYGEYLVFEELYRFVPGYGKILMNLEIPSQYGNNTEIDLVFIHETGLYVFEIKHYKGTIYGKASDERWTQYFRTVKNSHFYSPLRQNEGHIRALKNILPTAKCTSFIVFTNSDCELRVENDNPNVVICKLSDLEYQFTNRIRGTKRAYSMEGIDNVFTELLPFSPSMNTPVSIDGEIAPLASYINTARKKLDITDKNSDQTQVLPLACYVNEIRDKYQKYAALIYEDAEKKITRTKRSAILIACAFLILGGLIAYISNLHLKSERAAFEEQMNAMRQNFQHVKAYNAGDFVLADDYVVVTQSTLSNSKEFDHAVDFISAININSNEYGLKFTEYTKYVVFLNDGSVKEYDMFAENSSLNQASTLSKNIAWTGPVNFGKVILFDIEKDSISYIKLKNVELCDYPFQNTIKNDIEIELYSE
jgi:hypothetical protein